MAALLDFPAPPAPATCGAVQPEFVRVIRLDWFAEDEAPTAAGAPFATDTVYYALKTDPEIAWSQASAQLRAWVTERPGSNVIVSVEEMSVEEWVDACLGEREEAE